MTKNQRIELRVTAFEKETWARAAGGPRRVSEWLRALANEKTNPADGREDLPKGPDATPPGVQASGLCPRWNHHRPGVFCGSCSKVN